MKRMTPAEIRAYTPATEQWVRDALKLIGQPALDSVNNRYAYSLRSFELRFPLIANLTIPIFARAPSMPWWGAVYVRGNGD
jgi:hypothetical protein